MKILIDKFNIALANRLALIIHQYKPGYGSVRE